MQDMGTEKIPFGVKLTEGCYRGEASGKDLQHESIFEVRLNSGELFLIKAVHDYEIRKYTWTSYVKDEWSKLIPIVGRLIEKHFSRKQQLAA